MQVYLKFMCYSLDEIYPRRTLKKKVSQISTETECQLVMHILFVLMHLFT